MRLSIIIVNWNTRAMLAQCLRSIEAGVGPQLQDSLEVFVVDNASHDGSATMVEQDFPHVRLLRNQENVGFARANNQAIRKSRGEYVLLLNSDTSIFPRSLDCLVDFMNRYPNAGAAGSQLVNADGTMQVSCYPFPTLLRELWRLLHLDKLYPYARYRIEKWPLLEPQEVQVVQGACLLVRREALEQVGLLDEDYFMYTEEVDWCYRIRKAGWRIYWVPASKVTHFGGQSTKQVATDMFLQLYLSKLQYFRKHYGLAAAFGYKIVLFVAAVLRLSLTPLVLLEEPSKRIQHLTLADNYRRLLFVLPGM